MSSKKDIVLMISELYSKAGKILKDMPHTAGKGFRQIFSELIAEVRDAVTKASRGGKSYKRFNVRELITLTSVSVISMVFGIILGALRYTSDELEDQAGPSHVKGIKKNLEVIHSARNHFHRAKASLFFMREAVVRFNDGRADFSEDDLSILLHSKSGDFIGEIKKAIQLHRKGVQFFRDSGIDPTTVESLNSIGEKDLYLHMGELFEYIREEGMVPKRSAFNDIEASLGEYERLIGDLIEYLEFVDGDLVKDFKLLVVMTIDELEEFLDEVTQ